MKEVKRVIDMVGGAGYLQLALRADDETGLKKLSDAVHETLVAARQPDGSAYVRFITYKVPVEFVQENMVLFIRTEDLVEAKTRINTYVEGSAAPEQPVLHRAAQDRAGEARPDRPDQQIQLNR